MNVHASAEPHGPRRPTLDVGISGLSPICGLIVDGRPNNIRTFSPVFELHAAYLGRAGVVFARELAPVIRSGSSLRRRAAGAREDFCLCCAIFLSVVNAPMQ